MTGRNPQKTEERATRKATSLSALSYGFVTGDTPGSRGGQHTVEVQPRGKDVAIPMQVPVMASGDVNVPVEEGIPVLFARREGGLPVIVATVYTPDANIPDYEPGMRRLGHALSDAHVTFALDGSITVESDGGATVTLQQDGTVSINNGSVGVITDVSPSGTNSNGGITGLTITRDNTILI